MLLLGRFALPPLFAQAARTKSPELFLAASLLVVILASIATTAVGLSPIVGALLAGLLIAETEYHRSEEHTSELQSLMRISYAVLCLKKKTNTECGQDHAGP